MIKKTDAIKHFKGRIPLAEVLGCTPEAISMWGEFVPRSREYEIMVKSGGKLQPAQPEKLKASGA